MGPQELVGLLVELLQLGDELWWINERISMEMCRVYPSGLADPNLRCGERRSGHLYSNPDDFHPVVVIIVVIVVVN